VATVENLGVSATKHGLLVKTDSSWTDSEVFKVTSTTSDTTRFVVLADGNVGIGVTPTELFHVNETNTDVEEGVVARLSTTAGGALKFGVTDKSVDATTWFAQTGSAESFIIRTGGANNRLTIDGSTGLATFSNGIVVGNTNTGPIPGDYIHSNTAVSVASSSSFTLTVGSGLIIIYDTGGYGAVFWAEYGSITTKLSGNAFFDVSGGYVNVSKSAGTATVTVANAHAAARHLTVLVLANEY